MHTQEHFANTVKAVAAAVVSTGLAIGALTGATPEFLTQMYIDKVVAAVLMVAAAYYSLLNRAEPDAEPVE